MILTFVQQLVQANNKNITDVIAAKFPTQRANNAENVTMT